jgi:itaconate CoA-transferase
MHPMEGMRVIALEHAVAAPLCTRHLADMGADVIKIERPGDGDFARAYDDYVNGMCSHFIWLNRGKRSVTLDVKNKDARAALDTLISGADVLVQNLAPGAAARLGLTHEALSAANPKLVVCDISGYGESGPFVQKKAYDLLIQAESGLIIVTGSEYALTGILGALLRRGRTGQGGNVKIAMLDALGEWMTYPMLRHAYAGSAPPRVPTNHPAIAPYGAHRTKDGQIIIGLQNEREWAVFCTKVLGRPDVQTDPRFASQPMRRQNRLALTAVIEDLFTTMTSLEVAALLDEVGIANGRLEPCPVLRPRQMAGDSDRGRAGAGAAAAVHLYRYGSGDGRRALGRSAYRRSAGGDRLLTRKDRGDAGDGGDMTEFDPSRHRMVPEQRWFEDFRIGERFVLPSRTMTEAVFLAFQAASGDNHPIHYDVEFCKARGMPGLLAHGLQTLAQTAPGAGLFPYLTEDSLVGFIEQSSRFLKPVFAGDTIYPALEIDELTGNRTTGVVGFRSTMHNQRRELVLEGRQRYLLRRRLVTVAENGDAGA